MDSAKVTDGTRTTNTVKRVSGFTMLSLIGYGYLVVALFLTVFFFLYPIL